MLQRKKRWLFAQAGQGTVEYVGLLLLLATLLTAVVSATQGDASIADAVKEKLQEAIESVKPKS